MRTETTVRPFAKGNKLAEVLVRFKSGDLKGTELVFNVWGRRSSRKATFQGLRSARGYGRAVSLGQLQEVILQVYSDFDSRLKP